VTVGIVEGETVGRAEGPIVTYCISWVGNTLGVMVVGASVCEDVGIIDGSYVM